MRVINLFVFVCILIGCAGQQKQQNKLYTWPEKEGVYKSFTQVIENREKMGYKRVVIFVTADWNGPSLELKKYWQDKSLPFPIYEISADTVPEREIQVLLSLNIPLTLPLCILIDGEDEDKGYSGNGLKACSMVLEEKIKTLK